MIVGVDIGGHHVAAAIVDDPRDGIRRDTYRHRDVDADTDRTTLIAAWAEEIDAVIDAAGAPVVGVGIAMPGPFDYRSGVAYFENDNAKFGALYGVDVGAELTAASRHALPVRFLNDATAFAVGCHAMGLANDARRTLGITLGTGLGSAFLQDGIPVIEGGDVPKHGCLWHAPYRDSIADDFVSARWLIGAAQTALGRKFGGVADIADIARQGDERAAAIFTAYGDALASIIAPWVARFGVETLMLGGRISNALDLFGPALRERLAAEGPVPAIAVHPETEDAAIVGASLTFDPAFWAIARHRLPER